MFSRPLDLIDVALGKKYADIALLNGKLVNVNTSEIQENINVYIKGEWIAYVGKEDGIKRIGPETEIIDVKEKFLVPGFIDAHTHLLGQYINPEESINYIIPTGTTTLITEILEPYMVSGLDGLKELINFFSNQPIKVFFLAPTNISMSPDIKETSEKDLDFLLKRKDVLGIGESYWQEVIKRKETFIKIFNKTLEHRKTLEGHSAGAKGEKLNAYACFGITSCHEPIRLEEVIERLRIGMYVMIREGGVREDLKAMVGLKDLKIDKRKVILVTDSISPDFLLEKGYLNMVVQKAIDLGFDPIEAIQMVTINPAQHFFIEDFVGSISVGRQADILILKDLKEIRPECVISKGKILVKEGQTVERAKKIPFSDKAKKTISCKPIFKPEDFRILCKNRKRCSVRVIEFITELVTKESLAEVDVKDGQIRADLEKDIIKVCAVSRDGKNKFLGLVKGLGLKKGAASCSSCWDSADIVVVGTDDEDMAFALNRTIELQGGFVVSIDKKIYELPLSLYGLAPELSLKETVKRMEEIRRVLKENGFNFDRPWLTLSILTGAAIPFFRICEKGYVNFKEKGLKGLFAS